MAIFRTFSQEVGIDGLEAKYKLEAEFIGSVFREHIMPLTKDVEATVGTTILHQGIDGVLCSQLQVEYLLGRLDPPSAKTPDEREAKRRREA